MAGIEAWPSFRPQLGGGSGEEVWRKAFRDYFLVRLESRYFGPIKILKKHDAYAGEGFSVMTILCSVVEFLESTLQGKNYRYLSRKERKGGLELGEFEYSDSSDMFTGFLWKRAPFANSFDKAGAAEFYRSIRCGLLHEAQTKNGWRIRAKSIDGTLVDTKRKMVFRDDFHSAILALVRSYEERLLVRKDLQAAFLRKFDYLAGEAAKV